MERSEFERLAIGQMEPVYRMCLQLTRDQNTAEDLLQEVYLRALKPSAVARFEDRSSDGSSGVRAWLFTIAHNTFYSMIKRAKNAPTPVAEVFDQRSDEPAPGEAPPVWDLSNLDWEQVDGRLRSAIEALRPEFREVLLLWGVEGLKYREIAEIVGVPIGTVMSRLHRARKILADELSGPDGVAAELGVRHMNTRAMEESE